MEGGEGRAIRNACQNGRETRWLETGNVKKHWLFHSTAFDTVSVNLCQAARHIHMTSRGLNCRGGPGNKAVTSQASYL